MCGSKRRKVKDQQEKPPPPPSKCGGDGVLDELYRCQLNANSITKFNRCPIQASGSIWSSASSVPLHRLNKTRKFVSHDWKKRNAPRRQVTSRFTCIPRSCFFPCSWAVEIPRIRPNALQQFLACVLTKYKEASVKSLGSLRVSGQPCP